MVRARKRPRLSRRSSSSPTSTCGSVDHGAAVAQIYRHGVPTLEHFERRGRVQARRQRRQLGAAASLRAFHRRAQPHRRRCHGGASALGHRARRGLAQPRRHRVNAHPHPRDACAHRLRQVERDALRPKAQRAHKRAGRHQVRAQRADVAAAIAEPRGEHRLKLGRRFIHPLARCRGAPRAVRAGAS